MEITFKRFPLLRRKVLKNLDNQSLTRGTEAKRGFAEILDKERFYWIRVIKKYAQNFEGVEDSWGEILCKTPVDIVKQLALTVEEFFKYNSSKEVFPLYIVAKKGTLELFR